MSGDIANPRVWEGADVYVAPVGTAAPSDVATAWPAGWLPLGLLHENGGTQHEEGESTDHFSWGGKRVRTTRSKFKSSFAVTVLESNPVVFGLIHPGSSAQAADGVTTRTIKTPVADPRAFGLELRDGDLTRRIVIPKGAITNVGDAKLADNEMEGRELTIEVYAAADGTQWYEITDDPQADPDYDES